MSRLTAIAALLLCAQNNYAQPTSQVNNANIRHDTVVDGLYGNMGTLNVVENSNQNLEINSKSQNTPSFQSKNNLISLNCPHHFSLQSSNLPQSFNLPITSAQIPGLQPSLQPSNSLISSPNFKSSSLQDIFNSQRTLQDQNQNSNFQINPLQFSHVTPTSIPGVSSDFAAEKIIKIADFGFNSNIPGSIIMSQSIPSTYPTTASSFASPVPLQLGSLLQNHQSPMGIFRNMVDSPNTFPNYIISSDAPTSAYVERPKPSIWKELLPLILNVLKENKRGCGCCRKCCCDNKKSQANELQVYGGYSKEKRYGHSGEENNECEDDSHAKKSSTACEEEDDHDEGAEEVECESEET